jgi:hypothetical protein
LSAVTTAVEKLERRRPGDFVLIITPSETQALTDQNKNIAPLCLYCLVLSGLVRLIISSLILTCKAYAQGSSMVVEFGLELDYGL